MVAEFISRNTDRLPPANVAAEEAILGGILVDPIAIEKVVDSLAPKAFSLETHEIIYRAASNLHSQGRPTDLMTVTTWLADHNTLEKVGGTNKLIQLIDRTVSAVNIDQYAALVIDKYLRRCLINTSHKINDLAYSAQWKIPEILEEAEFQLSSVTEARNAKNLGNYQQTESEIQLRQLTREIEKVETIDNPFQKKLALKGLMKKWDMKSEKEFLDFHAKWLETYSKCRSLSLDEYLELHGAKSTEWLLEGWIPKTGITVMHSMGGLGKTTLFSHLSKCLITGKNWCGYNVAKPIKILWIQCDQGAKVTVRMFDRQGFFALDPLVKVRQRIIDKWGIEEYQVLRKELEEHSYDLVIIDSLTTVSANLIYRENDQEYARPIARLRHLSEEFSTAFVILHHSDWAGKLRGTTAIFNAADQVWALKKVTSSPGGTKQLDLNIEKSRFMDTCTYRLQFNEDDYGWDILGEVTKNAEGEEEVDDFTARPSFQKLYKFLSDNDRRGMGYEPAELAELLNMNLATVRKELGYGVKKALINLFRGARLRAVYFVGEFAGELNTSSCNKDPNDPETGSFGSNSLSATFDPNDPQLLRSPVESANLKNPGSNGSNGSNVTESEFQNDPDSGSNGSNVTESEFQNDPDSGSNIESVTDLNSPQIADDDIQSFVDLIRQAIANPECAKDVQGILSTCFHNEPENKRRIWNKLNEDEKKSFTDLTVEPTDWMKRPLKVGDRVIDFAKDSRANKINGEITALEPDYKGGIKDRFVHWVATVQWDDETVYRTPAEFLQLKQEELITEPTEETELKEDGGANLEDAVDIKAITLHQPWASLVGRHKHYETRGWKTNYRGKIAIHAAKLSPSYSTELLELVGKIEDLPLGAVIAIADLTECIEITPEFILQQTETELKCGDWQPGRFAYKLDNVQFLETPIPTKGQQGLWDWRPTADGDSVTEKWSPKVIAQKLFEQVQVGDELRALKHPSHKGFAKRRGKVIAKPSQINGKFLVKCQTNSGIKIFNLEAVELIVHE